jgi:hypothetical protein
MTDASLLESPPAADHVTDYDRQHMKTYLRLLDAAEEQADWREVAEVVLGLDPAAEPEHARSVHASHLARARWMTRTGFRDLIPGNRTR